MKKAKKYLKIGKKDIMTESLEMDEQFSKLASLIGEKARAKMLWHLLDGRAYKHLPFLGRIYRWISPMVTEPIADRLTSWQAS